MSISRKTPTHGREGSSSARESSSDEHTGEREISVPPISDVSLTRAAEGLTSDIVPARARATEPPTLIALGQEELLRLSTTLPLEDGVDAVARAVVDTVREVGTPCAAAVVLQGRVISALPYDLRDLELAAPTADGGPPRRLFSMLNDEWIVPLPAPLVGSLHVADANSLRARDPFRSRGLAELAERAVLVLTAGLDAARRIEASRVDVSHVRALQARIVQTEKLASVGQIAAKVVHELNNPLTAIVTYAGFLTKKLERAGHEEADVERLRRIGESADRILRFSRELTTYARPNDEAPGPVAIHEVVDRAVVFCEHVVIEHGIQVATRVDPHTPPTVGRRSQLTQVFVNLVTNACHAIQDAGRGEDGRIEIETTPTADGGVRVAISDNGNGISPEHVIRVFDPFFTTKTEGRGTGLGLSIVRSIIEGHGGRVWVRSVLGAGSSFIVELAAAPR